MQRIAIGVLGLALFTLLFGYFWPLKEAHHAVLQQAQVQASALDGNRQQLERVTQEVLDLKQERDALSLKVQRGDAAHAASTEADLRLLASIRTALAPKLKQAQMLVMEVPGGVQLVIDNARLYREHQESLYPQGQKLLCEVAKALGDLAKAPQGSEIAISVSNEAADPHVKNPMLKRLFPTNWELTAARAAAAARALEACGFEGKDLVAVAGAHYRPRKEAPAKSTGELRLLVVNKVPPKGTTR
jgi:chemotaxis protein MotB